MYPEHYGAGILALGFITLTAPLVMHPLVCALGAERITAKHARPMSSSWKGGSTRRWRRIRAGVLETKGTTCTLAIPGVCTRVATTVHHTLGRARTGDDPRYLTPACAPCNLHVGEPDADPAPKRVTQW